MSKKTRILALILAVIMLVGVMPLSLLAADDADASVTEPAAEEMSVLDYLASKATGTDYTAKDFATLKAELGENYTIFTEGNYTGASEGAEASFSLVEGSSTPYPNKEADTLIWKNGEAQLSDSSLTVDFADGSYDADAGDTLTSKINGAKTDITYTIVPNVNNMSKDASGNNTWVASFNMKSGELYNNYVARMRIYTQKVVETYTLNTETGEYEMTKTEESAKKTTEKQMFQCGSGNVNANGAGASGVFSTDFFTNFTTVYNYNTNKVELFINGVKVRTISNLMASTYYNVTEATVSTDDKGTPDDTSDDVVTSYTKTYYIINKAFLDSMYGTSNPVAGVWASYGAVRSYIAPADAVYPDGTYIEANASPLNGVKKIGDHYYYFVNGVAQGGKTVTVDDWNLVLEGKTGRITNYYKTSDIYTAMTPTDAKTLEGTTKVTDYLTLTLSNANNVTAYRYVTDDNGAYTYITDDAGNQLYADKNLNVITATEGEDGALSFAYDASGAVDTLDETTAYAPLLDDEGKQVTFTNGDTSVNVMVKVAAQKYSLPRNVLTQVSGTNIFELTRKGTEYYFESTAQLTLAEGSAPAAGNATLQPTADYQAITDAGFDITKAQEYVVSLDVKAGEGLLESSVGTINFGKIRFRNFNVTQGLGTNSDDNAFLQAVKGADGLYHLYVNKVDCGVFSAEVYTNIVAKFVPTDSNYYITVYVNGTRVIENVKTGFTATRYLQNIGVYPGSTWSKPLLYIGNVFAYSGTAALPEGTEVASELAYDGYVANSDGTTYRKYENNLIAADGLTAGVAELTAHNVTLGDKIGLNFHFEAGALAEDEGAKAVFTVGDETQTVYLKDGEEGEFGIKLTALLSSIQMTAPVTVELFDGDGNEITISADGKLYEQYTYTVREYAAYVVSNASSFSPAAVSATKAMVTYGAFAERYFTGTLRLEAMKGALNNYESYDVLMGSVGTVIEGLASQTHTIGSTAYYYFTFTPIEGAVDTTAASDDPSILTDADGNGSIQLVLDSTLKIRIALNVTEAPTVEGGELHVETDEEGNVTYYADIVGLTAADYNTAKTVTVNGVDITTSVLAVAKVIDDNAATYGKDFANLAKAMYVYYYYTDAYVKSLASAE